MTNLERIPHRVRRLYVVLVVVAVIVASLGTIIVGYNQLFAKSQKFSMRNLTYDLGTTFNPGSIQSFGLNNSSVFISGVAYYDKPADTNLPSLALSDSLNNSTRATPMISLANHYFHNGTVFGTAWNGSSWMLTGEALNGNVDGGSAIAIRGSTVTNLTSLIEPYFKHGGAWIDAWNGSGWLIGGNNDKQASLIGLDHGMLTNYTPDLGNAAADSWIQLLVWNGSSWLVGGHQVFGFLKGDGFSNLLSKTEFSQSGVYAALYQENEWIIGGGAPAGMQIISSSGAISTVNLPYYFTNWINGITALGPYLIIGGETSLGDHRIGPTLYAVSLSGQTPSFDNLTSMLPDSFDYGLVQFLSYIQFRGQSGVLIAGQGFYNETSGYSTGALAFLTFH